VAVDAVIAMEEHFAYALRACAPRTCRKMAQNQRP
jgi:hypothetical protein